jgi:hypothetical protein
VLRVKEGLGVFWKASMCESASSPIRSSITPKPIVDQVGSLSATCKISRSACLSGSRCLRGIVSLRAVKLIPALFSTRTVRPLSRSVQLSDLIVQSTASGM